MLSSFLIQVISLATFLVASTPTHATAPSWGNSSSILRHDTGVYGPEVEEFHYYYDQWPIGLAVSKEGRTFVCYSRGNLTYTVGEVVNKTAEKPWPNQEMNSPRQGLSQVVDETLFGSTDDTAFISVQALIFTPDNTLWVLDTGRPTINGTSALALPGGPKLMAFDINNNTVKRTYTFPSDVHYPDSYLNDVRIDQRANVTESGQGIAYLVDSSDQGRNGIIMLDLGTGESWRHLDQHPSVLRVPENVPSYEGKPFYMHFEHQPRGFQVEGIDGIQLSVDGETLFYSPMTSSYLYSIPAKYLRANSKKDPLANQRAQNHVNNLGQRGGMANGFEGDTNDLIYMPMPEHNAIYVYNSTSLAAEPFVRDPRILWPDTICIGFDGYLYININQLYYQAAWNNGVDTRQKPGAILRVKLENGGNKVLSLV
ncbi:hypothetical protein PGUG_02940 [Meyerozyma guilliermondii ATCC 6260]|uniref:Major royal jelly protein n=1 Tax=Meyerozyma guilliermondii (strain ATCC 6260 / CBS 566 / DSM 6381 / JCM 1539 / NBRC 10279 / NRRL Y-324) TaxID=294746 RepID=A5DI39_PICGU|nr:uncharacterized protein PGUG_02940 [Meyerozyma guilliermondii ATCC 6260]EDK38842.2 hypothetical protein PGUG_02940 [Meyerozyma guilliermondii ATCC 6260]